LFHEELFKRKKKRIGEEKRAFVITQSIPFLEKKKSGKGTTRRGLFEKTNATPPRGSPVAKGKRQGQKKKIHLVGTKGDAHGGKKDVS